MEHECQRSKHPLHVRVQDTEWDDEQNTQYCQVIQNVLPVQKVVKENIFCSKKTEDFQNDRILHIKKKLHDTYYGILSVLSLQCEK